MNMNKFTPCMCCSAQFSVMAAVVIVSDSDECGLDEDGIGKSLSKEDWKRLVEKEWLTDKVNACCT